MEDIGNPQMSCQVAQCLAKLSWCQKPLEVSLKQLAGSHPGVTMQLTWTGPRELAFLASAQAMMMRLVQDPHFQNH